MVCKHCQHNNPETNRFCGMCGQALPYPQVKSATTSIPSSSPNQAGTLGLRQSSASVGPIAPLAPKPQTAAPVSSEKKVQFPPVASPPQTSNPAASAQRTSAPATYAPVTSEKRVPPSVPPPTSVAPERRLGPRPPILEDTEKRAFVSPYPVAPRAPVVPEKKAQVPSSSLSLGSQASAPVDDRRVTGGVTGERKAPFPRAPLGPQPSATKAVENKGILGQQTTASIPDRRVPSQPSSYSQVSQAQPAIPSSPGKPAANGRPVTPEKVTQTQIPRVQQRLATQAPGLERLQVGEKRLQASAPIRMSCPSILGLNDEPIVDRAKDSDDLYKTNWGMRIFVVFVILAFAAGLMFLQWRSSHPVQASQHAASQAPTAQANNAVTPPGPTTPPANSTVTTKETTGSGAASVPQQAQDTQLRAEARPTNASDFTASQKSATPAKSVPQADPIRAGHEVATSKPPADLEQPVRQAEGYLQGKGTTRNCDQALGILRKASDLGNPRAQIKLGALYATGNCVATDKVSAYRYFSRAMRAQPNNTWLEQYRSSLWSNMNASERKQAMEVVR